MKILVLLGDGDGHRAPSSCTLAPCEQSQCGRGNTGCALQKGQRCQRLVVCRVAVQPVLYGFVSTVSSILPIGGRFFDKHTDAILCIMGEHILNHYKRVLQTVAVLFGYLHDLNPFPGITEC